MACPNGKSVRPAERGFAQLQRERGASENTDAFCFQALHARLTDTFQSGRTRSFEWRAAQLDGIMRFMHENSEQLSDALIQDLGRPRMESLVGDISSVVMEVQNMRKNLKSWMEPEAVTTPLLQQPGRSAIVREPKGVVLVISPWNFPVNISIASLASALCAGNCCVLKPSEVAASCEGLMRDLLPRYIDPDAVAIVTGEVPETTALLKLRWDHIMYTGNSMVARIVARAAAEHLTPVTLELGGKSPTVVLPGAKLQQAAKRILAGKLFNCGQICVAPDYLLVHESVETALVAELKKTMTEWYGDDAQTSPHFGRIVNENHFKRVRKLVEGADGDVQMHGKMDAESKFIPPTVIRNVNPASCVMQEEIFGPVLPIMKVGSIDDIVGHINAHEKPLAMYIFGREADAQDIIHRTSSGGVCVNDTIMQIANPNLPFGGVGNSGMGRYHGKWGFDELSHLRAVLYRATWIDLPMRYPPYTDFNLKMFQKVITGPLVPPTVKKALILGTGAIATLGASMLWSQM